MRAKVCPRAQVCPPRLWLGRACQNAGNEVVRGEGGPALRLSAKERWEEGSLGHESEFRAAIDGFLISSPPDHFITVRVPRALLQPCMDQGRVLGEVPMNAFFVSKGFLSGRIRAVGGGGGAIAHLPSLSRSLPARLLLLQLLQPSLQPLQGHRAAEELVRRRRVRALLEVEVGKSLPQPHLLVVLGGRCCCRGCRACCGCGGLGRCCCRRAGLAPLVGALFRGVAGKRAAH